MEIIMAVIELTKENFDEIVKNSEKPVLVDFWAEWCGPCKMLTPVVHELAEETDEVIFAKVNVDSEPDLAGNFGIMSIPTLILFKNGEKSNVSVGYKSKADLESFIKQ